MTSNESRRPSQSYQSYPDDEISLIDLAKILIGRWKLMAVVFLTVVVAAFVYVMLQGASGPEQRTRYTTLVSVGYKTPTVLVEPLRSVATQLEEAYIPSAKQKYNSALNVSVDFGDRDTNVIRLITSVSGDGEAEEVRKLHHAALEPLMSRHAEIIEGLEVQKVSRTAGILPANDAILLVPSKVTVVAQPLSYTEVNGHSASLVLALSVLLGGMLAVLSAFFMQFVAAVKESLGESS